MSLTTQMVFKRPFTFLYTSFNHSFIHSFIQTTVRMSKEGFYNSPVMTMRGKLNAPLPSSPARRNLFGSAPKPDVPASSHNNKVTTAVILPPKSSTNIANNRYPIMLTSPGKDPIRLYPVNQPHASPQSTAPGM